MKHLAAYLLLTLGGNASPSAKDITSVLESVGIEADSDRLDSLLKELEGKDINEVRQQTITRYPAAKRSVTDISTSSSSLRVPPSWLPSPRAVPAVRLPLLVALPPLAVLLRTSLRRRRRRRRRSPMMTWDSVSSTKRFYAEQWQESRRRVYRAVHERCRNNFTNDDCQGWFGVFTVYRNTAAARATAFRRHIEGNQKERMGIF
jgi:hypothetical protein